MKSAGAMPSGTAFYEKFGNGIQYMGIVEGENRDPFLDALRKKYGCKKLEEMFYDPLPGNFCIVETEPVLGFNLCVKQDGALNGAVKVILPDTAECTVVVSDIEESVRIWSDIFEIQKPKIVTIREKAMFRGQEIYADFRAAKISETPFTLYLVENSNAGPFAEFARENGYGIHHSTFDMGTACESFAAHMEEALDIDILTEYDLGGAHYIVFDSIKKMGAYIAAR